MWNRLRQWLSGPAPAPAPQPPITLVTVRQLDKARLLPQDLAEDMVGPETTAPRTCERCGTLMQRIVLTTGGPFGDPAVWAEHPVAIDGWRCDPCEVLSYPAHLSPDEITDLINEGIAHAQSGNFDDAEFALRRAVASWPTYSPAQTNLGGMHLDRIRAEQAGANRPEVIERYAQLAEKHFEKALACDPPPPSMVRFMLGKLLYRRNKKARALEVLGEALRSGDLPPQLREEAESFVAQGP